MFEIRFNYEMFIKLLTVGIIAYLLGMWTGYNPNNEQGEKKINCEHRK